MDQHTGSGQQRQARANFEDDLSCEYRAITRELPSDAFFEDAAEGDALTREEQQAMFRYFDLSNEQLRYVKDRRVSRATGKSWESGIRENLRLPRSRGAWTSITSDFRKATSRSCTCLSHPRPGMNRTTGLRARQIRRVEASTRSSAR